MNNYRIILDLKRKMYDEILDRENLTAENVVIVFLDVEAGWFDASVVVNDIEEYMFSFSDINDDIYRFVDWLKDCACKDCALSSVYIDCEFEQMVFTLEMLPTNYRAAKYASLGLLWWYNDEAEVPDIQYCIVDIHQFVTKTYLALLHATISMRFKILAWWQDAYMREDDEMANSKYDGYEFLEMDSSTNLVSNRLQLLFCNKIRDRLLDELACDVSLSYNRKPYNEIINVLFFKQIAGKYVLFDLCGKEYDAISLPSPSGDIIKDAIALRTELPENISLFCSDFSVRVNRRAPDIKNQTPYALNIPILIPNGAKMLLLS